MSAEPELKTRRWKRIEYERLVDCGVFQPGERVELVDGLLVVREPQSSPHVVAVQRAHEALRVAFGRGWNVRAQHPIALDDDSEPEPDIAVVPGTIGDYYNAHPSHPVLVVEVALTSLAIDREVKSSLYARAGVRDYWIVNLADRVLEVRREPVASPDAPYGWTYGTLAVLGPDDLVVPLAAPGSRVRVADLLRAQ